MIQYWESEKVVYKNAARAIWERGTLKDFCAETDMRQDALYHKLCGRTAWKWNEILKIKKALGYKGSVEKLFERCKPVDPGKKEY